MNNNPAPSHIEQAIERGLEFLQRNQLPSGEFKIYRSADLTLDTGCKFDTSPFPTATIAYCLEFSPAPVAQQMIKDTLPFLVATMDKEPVWNYCPPHHPWYGRNPPDVDDTALVSLVLERHGVRFPDNRKIILANRSRQGLFYTWLLPRLVFAPNPTYWKVMLRVALKPVCLHHFRKYFIPNDIDGIINANVLFYLGETEATAPVIAYLIQIIEQEKEAGCSVWYANRFLFYYAISRNYSAGMQAFEVVRETVVARILQATKTDGMIGGNVLDTALAVCALLNWGCDKSVFEKSIQCLLNAQRAAGDWPRIAMYYENPTKNSAWGSEEVTTGFCLEALTRY